MRRSLAKRAADLLSDHYDRAPMAKMTFFASPAYQASVHAEIMRHLRIESWKGAVRVVDLGCGTGAAMARILSSLRGHSSDVTAICLDPFHPIVDSTALRLAHPGAKVEIGNQDALAFAQGRGQQQAVSHILLKEMIHHIHHQADECLSGLFQQLEHGGRLCIVTRPLVTDYPFFFPRLVAIWKTTQPPLEKFASALTKAGFQHLESTEHNYQFTVDKRGLFDWIRARSFSEFSMLSPREMDEGIEYLDLKFQGQESVTFNDKLLLLSAQRGCDNK